MMRNSRVGLALLVVALLVVGLGPWAMAAQKSTQGQVAIVNGVAISKADFDREMGRVQQQIAMTGQQLDPAKMAEVKQSVLNGLINRELLYQESQKAGIKISDSTVTEHIAALKKKFPSPAEFDKILKNMNLTEADLRSQFKQDLAIKELIAKKITPQVKVTDADAKAFYNDHPDYFKHPKTVRASHILIKVSPKATPAEQAKAKKKLEEIQAKIKKGADFAAMAKKYSQGPSAAKGGDLGYFSRGQMVGPFENAAFALKKGQVSNIVKTKFGYHLIKVTDIKPAGVVPLDQVKDKIKHYLTQKQTNELLKTYTAGLEKKAKIKKLLD